MQRGRAKGRASAKEHLAGRRWGGSYKHLLGLQKMRQGVRTGGSRTDRVRAGEPRRKHDSSTRPTLLLDMM